MEDRTRGHDEPVDTVVVFRRRLLAWSETFVAAQGLALPHLRPVFAGVMRERSGAALLKGRDCHVLGERAAWPRLARWCYSAFGHVDARWLESIARERPLLVHAHFASSGARALPLARALGVPLVVTFHGYDALECEPGRRALAGRRRLFAEADRLLAVSDFLRDALIDAGAPPERTVRHYVGTAIEECDAVPPPGGESPHVVLPAVRPVVLPIVPPVVLFVGRLVAHKGCRHALEAFRRVRARMPGARLRIFGDGPERAALEALARGIGGIEFLGVRTPDEVRRALREARVLCNPSLIAENGWQEAFGLVFIEAQAVGTPAVAYANGGVGEAIAHGRTGFTVATGDVDALAARLLEVLRDDALHAALGAAGALRVRRRFHLATQCASLEGLYRETLRAHRDRV